MTTLGDLYQTIGGRLAPASAASDAGTAPLGRIQSDSRQIEPGDVFWALRGAHHDGAEFVGEAFHRGAAGAVVAAAVETPPNRWAIRVEDAQQALDAMGRLETPTIRRHGRRRDRQRGQDHHAADDPHGAASAARRHGQPAQLQQSRRRAAEHDGDGARARLRGAGTGRESSGRDRRRWPHCAGRTSA